MRDEKDCEAFGRFQIEKRGGDFLLHREVEPRKRFVQNHMEGPVTSARASATRCLWPPLSCEGVRSAMPGLSPDAP